MSPSGGNYSTCRPQVEVRHAQWVNVLERDGDASNHAALPTIRECRNSKTSHLKMVP